MDELKDKYFNTVAPTKPQRPKSLRLLLLSSVPIIILLASLAYAYNYYQKTDSAQYAQRSVQKQLETLLTVPDVAEYAWMRTLNPKAKSVEGGLVWSQKKRYGIMTFKNLPATTDKQQYHLRLYDRNTTQAFSTAIFQQNQFAEASRLVSFKVDKAVTSPYKFILSLESLNGAEDEQVLLRAQP